MQLIEKFGFRGCTNLRPPENVNAARGRLEALPRIFGNFISTTRKSWSLLFRLCFFLSVWEWISLRGPTHTELSSTDLPLCLSFSFPDS
jgi:hypothetical protein